MLCGLEEDRVVVVYVVCFIDFVVCCLIFVGDGCEEAYWVRYVPLVDGIFSFDWYSALEGGGRNCVILVPDGNIGGWKSRYVSYWGRSLYTGRL